MDNIRKQELLAFIDFCISRLIYEEDFVHLHNWLRFFVFLYAHAYVNVYISVGTYFGMKGTVVVANAY